MDSASEYEAGKEKRVAGGEEEEGERRGWL